MADNHTKEVRSYNMSRIRSKNTSPEETVRKFLFSKGLRYRKNDKRYPGHPDIILPKFKIIIFIKDVFGICMRNVMILNCQKQIGIIGYPN